MYSHTLENALREIAAKEELLSLQGWEPVYAVDTVAFDIAGTGQYGAQEFFRYLVLGNCLFVEDEEVVIACCYASLDGEEVAEGGLRLICQSFGSEKIRPFVFCFKF